jgi:hypothetical protein
MVVAVTYLGELAGLERLQQLRLLASKKQKINSEQDQSELSELPKEIKHHGVETKNDYNQMPTV